ncbi:MAG: NAD-dependent epimerase/dehydratase family protein [Paucibacter sp.]|nr:NAD-dependent epimerase/dehydratase family protein [Roseateles sp.]
MPDIRSEDVTAILSRELHWERLAGCRVLVSGAGGFLGGYLVRSLLALNHLGKLDRPVTVVAMVRNLDRARAGLGSLAADPQLELLEWDLNRIAVPTIGPCQYVLHAASQASPRFYGSDPVGTLLPNAIGTAALLEAWQRQSEDPRGFLFVSSSEVYGAVSDDRALTESAYGVLDPATVRACYAESKRLGETLCVSWNRQYGSPTFIVRPFHTYGPGLQADDGRVFADFVFNVLRGENIVMASDGAARRAFCYASDAVAGFFTVLLRGEAAVPYNVANPAGELSIMELAELMVSLYPEKQLMVERRARQDNSAYLSSTFNRLVPDVSRIQALGWNPRVAPAEGFRRMIEAYQA